jgi:chromosome partitioning protein
MITVIGSLKGGSGKSTTSFNLAVWLLTQDFTTAIFDLDPQQTLADTAECRAEDKQQPVLEVLSPRTRIKDKLLEADRTHTEVLVDIGNSNMSAAKIAYTVADRIIIPVLPSQSDVWSLQRFLKILDLLDTKPNLEILVFVNRGDTHHAVMETRETLAVLKRLPNVTVVTKLLSQRLGFRRSFSEGMGIFELEPRSKAAAEFLLFARSLYPLRRGGKKSQPKVVSKKPLQKVTTKKAPANQTSKKNVSKTKTRKKA